MSIAPCLLLVASLGCGRSGGLEKVIVEGAVSYNGEPVQNGEILFYPTGGAKGPVSGAPVVNGRYRAVAKGGVPVGMQVVKIEAYDTKSSGGGGDMTSGGRVGARVNYLPDKYHRASRLTVEITSESKTITRDFALEK
ncbi:MAG: hypothetical protein KDA37_10110 [Planctomycetales bacterium]|nr:hypothetical protein [Planctomycetales bacterium]